MYTYKYVYIFCISHIYIFTYIDATYVIVSKHGQIQEYTCIYIYIIYTLLYIHYIHILLTCVYHLRDAIELLDVSAHGKPPVRVFEKRLAALLPPVLQHGLQIDQLC